jgi:uncharacterized membrane protein
MTFCTKCGAAVSEGTTFCGSCGTQVTGAAQAGGGFSAAPAAGIQVTGLTSNVAAALTYLLGFITGIIFLVIEPYNKDPFVRFNAFQSIFLSIVYIVFSMVWGVLFGMLLIASLGFMFSLIALALRLVELAFFLLWLFLMYKAYKNERYMLPIIGPLAAKQAG